MSRRLLFWAIALCAVAAAFAQAWALRWTCDDAFISFRYAQNFVAGHGLVFNLDPSEAPVEGYTNFAWTMWLALGMALGFGDDRIELWSTVSGSLCHAAIVLLLAEMAWRASGGRARVPIAACVYAAVHHAASLAPAGLETALFVLLATMLLRFSLRSRCARQAGYAGCIGVLLAMTRPDGALFVGMAGLFVLHDALRARSVGRVVTYAAPFLLSFVPYLLWRHAYYGYWVPNTFYAKSAGDPYPSQGLVYVWEFAKCYWALALVPVLPLLYAVKKPDLLATVDAHLGRRPHLAVLAFALPYLAFVVWVGGDFMFGRFLLPVLPALLFGVDLAANRWRATWLQPALAAALVAGCLLRAEPPWLADYGNPHGFSDNRAISLKDFGGMPTTEAMRHVGGYLRGKFEGLDLRVGIVGSQANLAYRGRMPVVVECATGLTDARLAHQVLAQRGQPGHEKGYAKMLEYLTRERRVSITFDLDFQAGDGTDAYRNGHIWVWPIKLLYYDPVLLQAMKARDPTFEYTPFEPVLDAYLADLPHKAKEHVAKDFAAFRRFYFDFVDDAPRRARFEDFLR